MWIDPIGSAVFRSLTSYPSLSSWKKFHRRSWSSVIYFTSHQSSEKPHAFWWGFTVHVHIVTSCRHHVALSFNMEMLMPRRPWFWKSREPQLIPLCAWSSHKKISSHFRAICNTRMHVYYQRLTRGNSTGWTQWSRYHSLHKPNGIFWEGLLFLVFKLI